MRAVNPTNGEVVAEYPDHGEEAVERSVAAAEAAFPDWRARSFDERAELMEGAAEVLREGVETYARQMATEMGKPIEEARGEVEKCAWVCEYFAEHAESFLEPDRIETDASDSFVRYEPLGPILAIMPWNFPFWQVFRFAAPNLMAGNVGILSHAPNVPGCAESIAEVFEEAGFPEGTFVNLRVDVEGTQSLIRDDRIRGVTLTGSVGAGSAAAESAAAEIKPTVLELGGSDPFVVLEDAELEVAVEEAVRARTLNSGQSCIAAKRFIVESGIHDEFVEALEGRLEALTIGDPTDAETDVGPMAREDLRDELHRQVEATIEEGATRRLGGDVPSRPGWFYPVTLLTDVRPGMTAFDEETFGPVAAVTEASDVDDALRLANDSQYGLGASIWTDGERGRELVPELEAGHVAVNGIVKSDPRLPFGGIKRSGYGRELARHGIREFVNAKTVWVR